uniref:hypothetical protein n=1 Tax=uncultured Ruminococcus sp. TaxID=165186 RepID=UPI0026665B65
FFPIAPIRYSHKKSFYNNINGSFMWPREKISVNSTTVIKNDIVGRLEKQPLNFFTVYNKYRNLSSFSNGQPVEVHNFQFSQNSAPVSQRYRPLLCNLVGCQIHNVSSVIDNFKYTFMRDKLKFADHATDPHNR